MSNRNELLLKLSEHLQELESLNASYGVKADSILEFLEKNGFVGLDTNPWNEHNWEDRNHYE